MNKPKRSDYAAGRVGSKEYSTAMNKWRTSNKKVKPANNDPRPVWKKGESREEFRKRLLPWRERQEARKKKEKAEDLKKRGLKQTSRGLRPIGKTSNDLKVKKTSTAKDRVGKVDLNSQEYKEAKAANESIKLDKPTVKKKNNNNSSNNKGPNLEAANKILSGNRKEVTMADFKGDGETEKPKEKPNEKLKVNPKKMHWLEKRNRERFGDAHVDKLKKRYADFKAKRKKKKKK